MELFQRFDQLSRLVDDMNREAVEKAEVPFLRLHDYVHYCDVQLFLHAYARRLRLPQEEQRSLLAFCYRDTLEAKARIGDRDLYAYTFHFFKCMVYRTGNLDTPDDCVEKLDLSLLNPYRAAREKQWRGEVLTPSEEALLRDTEAQVLRRMRL